MDRRLAPFALSAFFWLLAWVALSAIAILGQGLPLSSHAMVWTHFAMLGFGFAGLMVVGVGHRLWKNFYGAAMPPTPLLLVEVVLFDLATLFLLGSVLPARIAPILPRPADWMPVAAVAGAVAAWIAGLIFQWRSVQAVAPGVAPGDRAARWLLLVPPLYAIMAAVLLVRDGFVTPSLVHLWLVGVVATTIFLVSHRFLPRFSRMPPMPRVHLTQALLAAPGPFLVTLALQGTGSWAWLGGLAELGAVGLYAVLVTAAASRPRSRQPVLVFHFAAGVALIWGVILGMEFVADPALRIHTGVHAVNNLVGFVLLTVWGMGSVLLGIAIRTDPTGPNRDVWIYGGLLVAALVLWELAAWNGWSTERWLSLLLLGSVALQASFGLRNALWLRRMGKRLPAV